MVHDRRVAFVRKWFQRAIEEDDEFDRFFSAWIALVVAAQRLRDYRGRLPKWDSDRKRVVDYFLAKKSRVMSAVKKREQEMMWLARRQGTRYGTPIIDTDTDDEYLCNLFTKLSRHYTSKEAMPDDEFVKALAELLNRIRNNVFHGAKVYDDKEDLELLKNVNPVLLAVLNECEMEDG
jgi:hypothetical protein